MTKSGRSLEDLVDVMARTEHMNRESVCFELVCARPSLASVFLIVWYDYYSTTTQILYHIYTLRTHCYNGNLNRCPNEHRR